MTVEDTAELIEQLELVLAGKLDVDALDRAV
jgi:hypothetical protein